MTSVAVVVPLSTRLSLTSDEEISLRHLDHFLGKYDKYFVAPKGLSLVRAGYETMWFPRKYFGSAIAHARLQMSEEFYARFAAYEYILMHHLDALVLSDRLDRWCETDLDFVGAPWLPSEDSPWVRHAQVGNSGFALMKVESFLNVIRSKHRVDPDELWREFCAANPPYRRWIFLPRKYLKRLYAFNNVRWDMWWWTRRKDEYRERGLLLVLSSRQVLASVQDCFCRTGTRVRLRGCAPNVFRAEQPPAAVRQSRMGSLRSKLLGTVFASIAGPRFTAATYTHATAGFDLCSESEHSSVSL